MAALGIFIPVGSRIEPAPRLSISITPMQVTIRSSQLEGHCPVLLACMSVPHRPTPSKARSRERLEPFEAHFDHLDTQFDAPCF
jgi:hypothetical protein